MLDRDYKRFRSETNAQGRWLAGFLALLLAVSVTSLAIAATSDPDWSGTVPENVSGNPDALQPDIASGSSERMAIVWSDDRSGQWNIYAAMSENNGRQWSEAEIITVTTTADTMSEMPGVVVTGDRVFAVWREHAGLPDLSYTIFEAELTGAYHDTRRIPDELAVRQAPSRPRMAAGAGKLHVVYNGGNENAPDIFYAARPLTATTWPTATIVYTHTGSRGSWYPALAVDPDKETLHVVWEERASLSNWAIMYMSGTVHNTSASWSPAITLSTGITKATWPDIAVDSSGNLHVAWGEVVGGYEEQYVRYKRYDATGGQWAAAERIDANPIDVNTTSPTFTSPRLALSEQSNRVCVTWHGFRTGDPEAEEVLLRCSDGDNWSLTQTESVSRSSDEEHEGYDGWYISIWPSIAFDASGQLHVVWQERTGAELTDYAIYHSRAMNKVFLPIITRNS